MDLREGATVLGGWTVTGPLPPHGELVRAAVTGPDGQPAEVVLAGPRAALRDAAGQRAEAAAAVPDHPAVVQVTAGRVSGRPARVRPRVTPWPAGQRVPPEQAAALAGWLGPAALAAGAALGGALTADDLVVDADGVPRLSPSGVVRERSLARLPLHEAPEGPEADPGAAALYGLGVLLFEAVTGAQPVEAASLGELPAARQRPLPAARARPDLPPEVAALLDALVSPDPTRRRAALDGRPPVPAPPALALHAPEAQTAPTPPPVAPRPTRSAARDVPLGDWVVLFEPADGTDAARTRLAALLDVPVEALSSPGPQVVADGRDEAAATARLEELAASGAPLRVVRKPRGRGPAVAVLALALLLAAAALVLPSPLTPFAIGGAVGLLVGANVVQKRAGPADLDPAAVGRAWSQLHAAMGAADGARHPAARQRLRQVRARVLQADLPDPMRVDLQGAMDDLDAQLEALPADGDPAPVLRAADAVDRALAARPSGGAQDAEATAEAVVRTARAAARALSQGDP